MSSLSGWEEISIEGLQLLLGGAGVSGMRGYRIALQHRDDGRNVLAGGEADLQCWGGRHLSIVCRPLLERRCSEAYLLAAETAPAAGTHYYSGSDGHTDSDSGVAIAVTVIAHTVIRISIAIAVIVGIVSVGIGVGIAIAIAVVTGIVAKADTEATVKAASKSTAIPVSTASSASDEIRARRQRSRARRR